MTASSNYLQESHDLVNALIAVRYKNASASELRQRCLSWISRNAFTKDAIRQEYANNRMLPSQLDLFDKAKLRVENVLAVVVD